MKKLILLIFGCAVLSYCTPDIDEVLETEPTPACLIDVDGDGFCADEDPNDNDATIYIGAPCDDGKSFTVDDKIVDMEANCSGFSEYWNNPLSGKKDPIFQYNDMFWTAQLSLPSNISETISGIKRVPNLPLNVGARYVGTYDAIMSLADLIPGWHVPTLAESSPLMDRAGLSNSSATLMLKTSDTPRSRWTANAADIGSSSLFGAEGLGRALDENHWYNIGTAMYRIGQTERFVTSDTRWIEIQNGDNTEMVRQCAVWIIDHDQEGATLEWIRTDEYAFGDGSQTEMFSFRLVRD